MRLLLVEDDASLAEALKLKFRIDGHVVDCVGNGSSADSALRDSAFDLVLLDLNLPGLDGLEVLRRLRRRGCETPVLVLSACDAVEERVRGLDLGADDYLGKPFSIAELGARVRALLRRVPGHRSSELSCGRLTVDTVSRTAHLDGRRLELPSRELNLLEALLLNVGRVVSKERLLSQLYGFNGDVAPNTIEVYVSRLRRKLQHSGLELKTMHGRGYLLSSVDDGAETPVRH